MAEFVGLVNDDLSLPLPETDMIDIAHLRYVFDAIHGIAILYQKGREGERVSVDRRPRLLHLPAWILGVMGLSPGDRFYSCMTLFSPTIPWTRRPTRRYRK